MFPAAFYSSLDNCYYYYLWEKVNFCWVLAELWKLLYSLFQLNNIYHRAFLSSLGTKRVLIPKWTDTAVFIVRSLSIKNGKASIQHIPRHLLMITLFIDCFPENGLILRKLWLRGAEIWFITIAPDRQRWYYPQPVLNPVKIKILGPRDHEVPEISSPQCCSWLVLCDICTVNPNTWQLWMEILHFFFFFPW